MEINLETLSVLLYKVVSIEQLIAATCNFQNPAVRSPLVQALQEHWAMHDDQNSFFHRHLCMTFSLAVESQIPVVSVFDPQRTLSTVSPLAVYRHHVLCE